MQYSIGIDLGGTNIAAGIIDEQHHLVDTLHVSTQSERPWEQVAADMAQCVQTLLTKNGLQPSSCSGLGVGVPGVVDNSRGMVLFCNNLGWQHVPLAKTLQDATGLPVRLSNDANCAALGEVVAGAAKGKKNAVLLTLGTGVGGGVIIDGKIYEGTQGAGTELGHGTLVVDGLPCTCGRKGCIEVYASATALIRQAKEALALHPESLLGQKQLDGRSIYDAMRANDQTATEVVRQYEHYLGEAVVTMVNIFRPEILLIGGGISGEGKPLVDRLNAYVKAHCYASQHTFVTPVQTASLGNKAGIVGAAALFPTQA